MLCGVDDRDTSPPAAHKAGCFVDLGGKCRPNPLTVRGLNPEEPYVVFDSNPVRYNYTRRLITQTVRELHAAAYRIVSTATVAPVFINADANVVGT